MLVEVVYVVGEWVVVMDSNVIDVINFVIGEMIGCVLNFGVVEIDVVIVVVVEV